MGNTDYTSHNLNRSSTITNFDLVIEKLQTYHDYLEKEVSKKSSGCTNGTNSQNTVADLEQLRGSSRSE